MSAPIEQNELAPETTFWRPLRHFNLYRATLALTLLVLFQQKIFHGFLNQPDRQFFLIVNIAFLASSLFYLYAEFHRKLAFTTQVIAANISDILLIVLLMHFSGGVSSG
ncbi:MAG TPA: hypothetical protein VFY78_04020, partial [Gammaproteobacteria bacterium]|nr:hypothetical protein [Gammaproteobacteria bacterium]